MAVIGYYGLLHVSGQITEHTVAYNVGKMVLAGVFISVWCYGMICIYDDWKAGGIRQIIKRITRRKNGSL